MRKKGEGASGSGGVESVHRTLLLMRMIAMTGGVRLSEASTALDLPHSTVHRLLATLQRQGYVTRARDGRRYVPGPALAELGALVTDDTTAREAARPALLELVERFGETAHLMTLRGTNVLYTSGVESRRVLRVGLRVGTSLPAHCGASGKALLAELSDDAVRTLYPDERLPPVTPQSITRRATLLDELERVRRTGYAVNDGESEPDIRAVAAVVVDPNGWARGALVVAAPANRLTTDDIPYLAAALVATAKRVGHDAGRAVNRLTEAPRVG